jgi:hypothetical protein
MGGLLSAAAAAGTGIASTSPATQASQQASWLQVLGSAVQGTVSIIQQIQQPTRVYPSVLAGVNAGAAGGASQSQQTTGTNPVVWVFGLVVVGLLVTALVLMRRR